MSLPIGSSARLVLREAVPEDAAFMLALLNEPAWRRYIADHEIQTLAQAAQYIEDKLICAYREHGFGLWIVIEQVTGTAVGLCGFLKREALPVMDLGFAFRQAFWGRGYAKEASQAALDIAWQQGHSEVLAITLPKNQRAIRTLESLGFGYRSVFS